MGKPALKLGILGTGWACETLHAPALLRLRDVIRVAAVSDIDPLRAQKAAGRFPGARVCDDPFRLIESPDVDAVAVLAPPAAHAALALAALDAGKHVLVEKPLAASVEDAQAMAARASRSGLCAAAGHNLRFHRLVRRARAAVRDGLLGDLVSIGFTWTTPGAGGPAWRSEREQGGGVIFDLGVHHIDLARFLSGSEFEDVRVSGDDRGASVSGRMCSGVLFSAVWATGAASRHSIRLNGTRASVEFSPYSAGSWRVLPEGCAGLRAYVREAAEQFAQLPAVAGALRTGGDLAGSYRLEWLDFANAAATGAKPECGFEDALRSVEVCQSLAPRRAVRPAPALEPGPALSVVLAVYGSYAAVRRTVRHLRAQTVRDRIELILVTVDGQPLEIPPAGVEGFFNVQTLALEPGATVAEANAAGTRAAAAPVVAFAEDHCFPEPGWAAALLEAHAHGVAAVGPEIANANPASVVSWCDYLIGYGFWMSPCPAGEAPFLPGHNSSYKRAELLAYGEKLEAMLESETVLHLDLARRGRKLYLEPRARAAHLNFAVWGVWLRVQYHWGRLFASSRASAWGRGKRLFYSAASPLIPAVRAARICRELLKRGRPARLIPRVLPALAAGLAMDGAGQMIGYLTGPGRSASLLAEYEYDRIRYIRPEDLRALEQADERVGQAVSPAS